MPNKIALISLGLSFFAISNAQFPGFNPPSGDYRKGYDAITIDDAKKILGFLAGPECEGRGTGEPGFQKAAEFVAKRFKEAHLKPLGDNGTYFQNVPFYRVSTSVASVAASGKQLSTDGFAISTSGNTTVSGPVVYIQTANPSARLTEEQIASLKGKIVFLDPPKAKNELRSQLFLSDAVAILTVSDTPATQSFRVSQRKPNISTGSSLTAVVGTVSRKSLSGLSDALKTAASTTATDAVSVVDGGLTLDLKAEAKVEEVLVPNVVGMLEGSDPKLKEEIVGIGGHLDHLGKKGETIYYGADDDGSGSTAVLQIVKAFATNKKKPRRSIIFMTFYGEEMGLLGSKYLSEHPPVSLDKWVAELQMDMVGRDSYGAQNGDQRRIDVLEENRDTMRLVGSKRISTELDAIIQEVNKNVGFKFKYDSEDVYTRSDHYNFAAKGVPISFLFDGFTPDYHQPSDTVDKINFLKLTNAAKLYYLTAFAIADRDAPLKKDVDQTKN